MRNPFRSTERSSGTQDNTAITPSTDSLKSELEVQEPRTDIDFVFIRHSKEHINRYKDEIIKAVNNKQVIMIELVTPDKASRMQLQATLNDITHSDLGPDELEERIQEQDNFGLLDEILCRELVNSGVDILLVDVNEDSSNDFNVLLHNSEMMRYSFSGYIKNFGAPSKLIELMLDSLHYEAEEIKYRDKVVIEQLQKTVAHKYYSGKKIAVIVGAAHTAQYNALQHTPGVYVDMVYPGSLSPHDHSYALTHYDEVRANLLKNEPEANTSELLNKALLEQTIRFLSSFDIGSISTKEFRTMIDKLSPEEVSAILEQVCELGIYDEQERIQRADQYLSSIIANLQ